MSKIIEATGKTIEEAIANGLAMLGVDDSASVETEVIERPKSGFLGIGGTAARVKLTYTEEGADKITGFLNGLFEKMEIEAQVSSTVDEENNTVSIDLSGENMGILIGRRGETLDAIQHITNLVANHGQEKHVRVMIDTENYRKKREESLTRLAHKIAGQAKKYRRNKVLEPMNAYERHVIHAALQDVENISTSSTGAEPNRRVVISYTGPQHTRPAKPVVESNEESTGAPVIRSFYQNY